MPTVLVGHYCDIVSDRSNLREKGIFGSRVQEVTAHNIKGMPWGQWEPVVKFLRWQAGHNTE